MPTPLPKFSKGKAPTLLETDLANVVRAVVNGMLQARISPDGYGTILVPDNGGIVIDLTGLDSQVQKIVETTIKETLKANAVNQLSEAITTTPGLVNTIWTALQPNVTEEIKSLFETAIFTATCNPDSTISISITFPE